MKESWPACGMPPVVRGGPEERRDSTVDGGGAAPPPSELAVVRVAWGEGLKSTEAARRLMI
jgi:hypothetical protein